ncbi:MAG: hypothetical protein Q8O19_02150, partial [Rectinemataceae bacterium]|nr:hypothetical protein [Rectinemataceae bacterium]
NGAWCIFSPPPAGTREGKAVLVWHSGISDPHTGGQYTLKIYRGSCKTPGLFVQDLRAGGVGVV